MFSNSGGGHKIAYPTTFLPTIHDLRDVLGVLRDPIYNVLQVIYLLLKGGGFFRNQLLGEDPNLRHV